MNPSGHFIVALLQDSEEDTYGAGQRLLQSGVFAVLAGYVSVSIELCWYELFMVAKAALNRETL